MSPSQAFARVPSKSKDGLSLTWPHNQAFTKTLEQASYVHHPLFLSAESLEMCTESLGSESGNGIDPLSFDIITEERRQSCVKPRGISIKHGGVGGGGGGGFPPPLSSVVGVRTHREGGRLVMEAFTLSRSRGCFVAERGEGRLRLSLPRDMHVNEAAADATCGNVGCVYGGIRCNGGSSKTLHSLPFCVAGIS